MNQTPPQDIVEENGELVHKLWIEAKGSVYVCGKVLFTWLLNQTDIVTY